MAGILKVDRIQSDSNLAFSIAGSNVAFMNATSLQMTSSNISLGGTNVITNGKVVASGMPTGAILQVVQGTYSTEFDTNSTSFVNTNLTANITPLFASSNVLVMVVHADCAKFDSNNGVKLKIVRNSTDICTFATVNGFTNSSAFNAFGSNCEVFLDSPATTSATTYKTQVASTSASVGIRLQYNNATSTITLMEIAA